MAYTSKEIIEYLEKKYPKEAQPEVKNYADVSFYPEGRPINQYILGIAAADPGGPNIYHYESYMKDRLGKISQHVNCLPWSFRIEELEQVKSTLKALADYFSIELDVEKMVERTINKRSNNDLYFIVVTVVQCMVVSNERVY